MDGDIHRVPLRSHMDATDAGPLIQMALADLGVMCLPRLLVHPLIEAGQLKRCWTTMHPTTCGSMPPTQRHTTARHSRLLAFLEAR